MRYLLVFWMFLGTLCWNGKGEGRVKPVLNGGKGEGGIVLCCSLDVFRVAALGGSLASAHC